MNAVHHGKDVNPLTAPVRLAGGNRDNLPVREDDGRKSSSVNASRIDSHRPFGDQGLVEHGVAKDDPLRTVRNPLASRTSTGRIILTPISLLVRLPCSPLFLGQIRHILGHRCSSLYTDPPNPHSERTPHG